ncbi:hypothetical protein C8J57DRAFT_1297216 [Mycena rebaudengoi]|nr:hypothetical protein C8J57DRAFT_1297216 [Mycena rebaudengoi]
MTDSMSYSSSGSYISQASYYSSPQIHHGHPGHVHEVSPQIRPETTRKRPKYTRSKTGCLTCRVKKIKCDETKPSCMRCTHGQRDCTWPEGAPTRKRASSLKDSSDGVPSTASSTTSPGVSESSSPTSTRGHSPPSAPQRTPIEMNELNLPPLIARRQPEPYHLPRMHHPSDVDPPRREYSSRNDRGRASSGYSPHESSHSMALVPEISAYPGHSRYEQYASNGHHASHIPASRHGLASSVRSTMGHPSMQQWSPPPIMSPEPYYTAERAMIHSGEQDARYH